MKNPLDLDFHLLKGISYRIQEVHLKVHSDSWSRKKKKKKIFLFFSPHNRKYLVNGLSEVSNLLVSFGWLWYLQHIYLRIGRKRKWKKNVGISQGWGYYFSLWNNVIGHMTAIRWKQVLGAWKTTVSGSKGLSCEFQELMWHKCIWWTCESHVNSTQINI